MSAGATCQCEVCLFRRTEWPERLRNEQDAGPEELILATHYQTGEMDVHPNDTDWEEVESAYGDPIALRETLVGLIAALDRHRLWGGAPLFRATLTPEQSELLDRALADLQDKEGTES